MSPARIIIPPIAIIADPVFHITDHGPEFGTAYSLRFIP
jgi:hypothetical protein